MELIDEKIFQNLKEIANRLIVLKRRVAQKYGISLSESNILCVVLTCEPIMQSRLGEFCGIDKPATSRIINKMLKADLIVKNNMKDNRKSSFIKLSQKGRGLVEKIYIDTEKEKNEFFNVLSVEDKEVALKLMNKVLRLNCE